MNDKEKLCQPKSNFILIVLGEGAESEPLLCFPYTHHGSLIKEPWYPLTICEAMNGIYLLNHIRLGERFTYLIISGWERDLLT